MNHEASGRSRVLDSLPADIRDALSEQMEEVLILQSTRAAENRNAAAEATARSRMATASPADPRSADIA
ncbi:acetylesterase, partial [Geobacillus sp. MMMUD3]|nr:acetylesterase [Geobacillus sp. MMMUD3]